jgi:hypothetical protein
MVCAVIDDAGSTANMATKARVPVRALKGRLDDANRARNSHQTAGKGKLSPEERETHTNKGRELKADGAQALILDLRGNPGGLLSETVQIAKAFAPHSAAQP